MQYTYPLINPVSKEIWNIEILGIVINKEYCGQL